jgi:hypothetical protein
MSGLGTAVRWQEKRSCRRAGICGLKHCLHRVGQVIVDFMGAPDCDLPATSNILQEMRKPSHENMNTRAKQS